MAFTVNRTQIGAVGNSRMVGLDITADAATQTVETGLKSIVHFSVGIQSATTGSLKIYHNSNASGVQSFGVLGISGVATGDEFFVMVYGS